MKNEFTKEQIAEIRQNITSKIGAKNFEIRQIDRLHYLWGFEHGVWIKLPTDSDLVYVRV